MSQAIATLYAKELIVTLRGAERNEPDLDKDSIRNLLASILVAETLEEVQMVANAWIDHLRNRRRRETPTLLIIGW